MHAFDFILVLFSFVYAAAVTHVLCTAGAIIIASKLDKLDDGRTAKIKIVQDKGPPKTQRAH